MATDVPSSLPPDLAHHLATCVPWGGQTCRVRRFRPTDAQALYAFAKLPEVSQHMSWDPHTQVAQTQGYLDEVIASYGYDANAPWAIATPEQDTCVGFVSLTHFCAQHLRTDFAIGLHPAYAGRGMAQEACRFVLAQARALGLMRVQAVVEADNPASLRLMQRLGMQEQVLLHHYLVSKSGAKDAYLFATFFADNAPK